MATDEGMEESFLSSSESDRVPISDYGNVGTGIAPRKYGQTTVVGDIRNVKRFSWLEWIFIFVGILAFLSTLGLTIERFVYFKNHYNDSHNASEGNESLGPCHSWTCLSDVTFAAALVVNIVFTLMYGFNGLLREKGYELLGVLVAIVGVIIYLTTNFIYHVVKIHLNKEEEFETSELAIRIARLVISWVLGIILGGLTLGIFFKLGRLMFSIVGGNRELMRAYKMSSFLTTLLFFNVQAIVNLLILAYVREGTFIGEAEKIILPILVAYIIVISPIGYVAILYEFQTMTVLFLFGLLPASPYYIYKIINIIMKYSDYTFDSGIDNHYELVAVAIIIIDIIAMLLLVLIGIFGVLIVKNFGKGLKDKIDLPFSWCYKKLPAARRN